MRSPETPATSDAPASGTARPARKAPRDRTRLTGAPVAATHTTYASGKAAHRGRRSGDGGVRLQPERPPPATFAKPALGRHPIIRSESRAATVARRGGTRTVTRRGFLPGAGGRAVPRPLALHGPARREGERCTGAFGGCRGERAGGLGQPIQQAPGIAPGRLCAPVRLCGCAAVRLCPPIRRARAPAPAPGPAAPAAPAAAAAARSPRAASRQSRGTGTRRCPPGSGAR